MAEPICQDIVREGLKFCLRLLLLLQSQPASCLDHVVLEVQREVMHQVHFLVHVVNEGGLVFEMVIHFRLAFIDLHCSLWILPITANEFASKVPEDC